MQALLDSIGRLEVTNSTLRSTKQQLRTQLAGAAAKDARQAAQAQQLEDDLTRAHYTAVLKDMQVCYSNRQLKKAAEQNVRQTMQAQQLQEELARARYASVLRDLQLRQKDRQLAEAAARGVQQTGHTQQLQDALYRARFTTVLRDLQLRQKERQLAEVEALLAQQEEARQQERADDTARLGILDRGLRRVIGSGVVQLAAQQQTIEGLRAQVRWLGWQQPEHGLAAQEAGETWAADA